MNTIKVIAAPRPLISAFLPLLGTSAALGGMFIIAATTMVVAMM